MQNREIKEINNGISEIKNGVPDEKAAKLVKKL